MFSVMLNFKFNFRENLVWKISQKKTKASVIPNAMVLNTNWKKIKTTILMHNNFVEILINWRTLWRIDWAIGFPFVSSAKFVETINLISFDACLLKQLQKKEQKNVKKTREKKNLGTDGLFTLITHCAMQTRLVCLKISFESN